MRMFTVAVVVAGLLTVPASAHAATDTVVAAAADTYVVAEQPAQTFGAAPKLAASNWSTPWHSDIYVRFAVPQAPIASARLEFTFQKVDQQPSLVELRAVGSTTWSEASTSYANRPALGAVIATAQVTPGATTVAFDVTGKVGNGSFAVTNPTAQSAAVVHSREHPTGGPRLVLRHGSTLCGASFTPENGETWQQALAREDTRYGGLEAVRTFYGGLPPAWPGQVDTGERVQVVSFKRNPREYLAGTHDAYMRDWFAAAPRAKDVYWTFYHEPEDNIAAGEFTAAEYRAAWTRLAQLAAAAGNPRLHATMVLMEWTLNPASGRDWRAYYPGDGVLDVLAWDVYNYVPRAQEGVYLPPAQLLDRIVAVNRSLGLPFGVAEMGSHLANGDTTGARRGQWIRDMNAYLQTHGSLWNLWFDLDWPTGDYRLLDAPSRDAWRDLCA